MKRPPYRTIAETIGVVAIVLSLVFVALELRQNQEIAFSELRSAVLANGIALNSMITDNADVWVRGNSGEDLDAAESEIYFRLIQSYNDFYYNLVEQSVLLDLGWENSDRAMLIGFLHDNPGARRVWLERDKTLTRWRINLGAYEKTPGVNINEWVDAIEAGIQQLEAAGSD